MAWTTPAHVSGGLASSAQFNEETVDNLQHLYDLLGGLKIQTGSYTVNFAGTSEENSGTINFGSAFGAAPNIVGSVRTVVGEEMVVNFSSVTTSGFNSRIGVADGSTITATITVNYIAIGTA